MKDLPQEYGHVRDRKKIITNGISMNGDAFIGHFQSALLLATSKLDFHRAVFQYLEWMPVNTFLDVASLFSDKQPKYRDELIAAIKSYIDTDDSKTTFVEFSNDYSKFKKL